MDSLILGASTSCGRCRSRGRLTRADPCWGTGMVWHPRWIYGDEVTMHRSLTLGPLLLALGACPAKTPPVAPQGEPPVTPETEPPPSSDTPTASMEPAADHPELAERVLEKFADNSRCELLGVCGELAIVDCGSAVDGPLYYVQRDDLSTVSTCGGACMSPDGCTNCPPAQWQCK